MWLCFACYFAYCFSIVAPCIFCAPNEDSIHFMSCFIAPSYFSNAHNNPFLHNSTIVNWGFCLHSMWQMMRVIEHRVLRKGLNHSQCALDVFNLDQKFRRLNLFSYLLWCKTSQSLQRKTYVNQFPFELPPNQCQLSGHGG